MANNFRILNAARTLEGFIWKGKTIDKFKLTKENKIEIEQDVLLKFLMDFQKWQKEETERLDKDHPDWA